MAFSQLEIIDINPISAYLTRIDEPIFGVLVAGNIIIAIGIIFMIFGIIGLFRFKDFYPRILMAAKIDTIGMMTLLLGLIVRDIAINHAFTFFGAKLVLVFVIILILNPLVGHVMVRSAYVSGYGLKGELTEENPETDNEMEEDEFSKPVGMEESR